MPTDPWNLTRFLDAQDGGRYDRALAEIGDGRKTTHWMWFVFPQHIELGHSATAKFYGISGLGEAQAYFAHPVLGARLVEITRAVLANDDAPEHIFGSIDALKLRSSMTLFALAAPEESVFGAVLEKFYDGDLDAATVTLLQRAT
jgi:uncharacterized protein (DUF1810 family)